MKRVLRRVLLALVVLSVVGVGGFVVAGVIQTAWLRAAGARWHALGAPVDSSLRAMWSAAADDLWFVGDHGVVVRRTKSGWSQVPSGVRADLAAVWGSGPNDVWVAGGGCVLPERGQPPCEPSVILHWDGRALSRVETPFALRFNSVAGAAADDVWFGGWLTPHRVLLHWDGSAFAARAVPGDDLGSHTTLVPAGGEWFWFVSESCVREWRGAAWAALGRAFQNRRCGGPDDAPAPVAGNAHTYNGAAKYDEKLLVYASQPFGLAVTLNTWDGTAWTSAGHCKYDGLQSPVGGWAAPDGTFWLMLNGMSDVYRWRAGRPCERVARLKVVPTGMGGAGAPWVLGTKGRVLAAALD
jgi:hypothetical protein